MRSSVVVVVLCCAACFVGLDLPPESQVLCAAADDCPAGSVCVVAVGRCVDVDSACVLDDGGAAGDGTACGDGLRCVDGACRGPFCGDGFVDDGEECDPRNDVLCREGCIAARCGDGILDSNEGCDSDRDDCVACTQLCPAGKGDCDFDVDNGCECDTPAIFTGYEGFVVSGVVDGDFLFLSRFPNSGDLQTELVRVDLRDNSLEVIVPRINSALFVQNERHTWVHIDVLQDDGVDITAPIIDGVVQDDVFRVPTFGIALVGDDLFVNHLKDGIYRHDAATGLTGEKLALDVCIEGCELQPCGDGFIISDYLEEGTLISHVFVDAAGVATHLFDTVGTFGNFGCTDDGTPTWVEGRSVLVLPRDPSGERRVVAQLPALDTTIVFQSPLLTLGGEPVVSAEFGFTSTAVRVRPFGGLRAVGAGFVVPVPRRVFLFEFFTGTLSQFNGAAGAGGAP